MDVHDFPSDAVGEAIPYGVHDVAANEGFVSVSVDHDTLVFAVRSILRRDVSAPLWVVDEARRHTCSRSPARSHAGRIAVSTSQKFVHAIRALSPSKKALAIRTSLNGAGNHEPPRTSRAGYLRDRLRRDRCAAWQVGAIAANEQADRAPRRAWLKRGPMD